MKSTHLIMMLSIVAQLFLSVFAVASDCHNYLTPKDYRKWGPYLNDIPIGLHTGSSFPATTETKGIVRTPSKAFLDSLDLNLWVAAGPGRGDGMHIKNPSVLVGSVIVGHIFESEKLGYEKIFGGLVVDISFNDDGLFTLATVLDKHRTVHTIDLSKAIHVHFLVLPNGYPQLAQVDDLTEIWRPFAWSLVSTNAGFPLPAHLSSYEDETRYLSEYIRYKVPKRFWFAAGSESRFGKFEPFDAEMMRDQVIFGYYAIEEQGKGASYASVESFVGKVLEIKPSQDGADSLLVVDADLQYAENKEIPLSSIVMARYLDPKLWKYRPMR